MIQPSIKTGQVLLAEPFMEASEFRRAAILLTDHSEEDGTIGFILNKKMDMNIDSLVVDFPEFDSPVFYGGPVATDTIHYIHNVGELLENSTKVLDGIYWGGDFEKLKFLIKSELIQPKNIRFFVGYSGWSEGQLRDEMGIGTWVTANMDANYLFRSNADDLWRIIMGDKGNTYQVISEMPDTSLLN